MRSPSPRVLTNTADVYPYVPAQDADAGTDASANYPAALVTGVACSAQPDGGTTGPDELGRVTTTNKWLVIFGPAANAWNLKARDKLVLHVNGRTHTAFVAGDGDGAGRGAYGGVGCEERV